MVARRSWLIDPVPQGTGFLFPGRAGVFVQERDCRGCRTEILDSLIEEGEVNLGEIKRKVIQ
jgi:hypothetical protein